MRRLAIGLGAVVLLGLLTTPASAENPVFDDGTAADIQAALDQATAKQGVCYGVRLDVQDSDTGRFAGSFAVTSTTSTPVPTATSPAPTAGPLPTAAPVPTAAAVPCRGSVFLRAYVYYESQFSDFEDTASWSVESDLPGAPTTADLARLGLSASALLDDARSEQTLLNATLSLPALTAERVDGVVPLLLAEATASPPAEAAPTDTPGSDVLRQSGGTITLLVLLLLACLGWAAYAAFAPRTSGRYGTAVRTAFGGGPSYDDDEPYERRYGQPRTPRDPESY